MRLPSSRNELTFFTHCDLSRMIVAVPLSIGNLAMTVFDLRFLVFYIYFPLR